MTKTNPFFLLKQINDKFEARANNVCQTVDLTLSQFRALIYLTEHSDSQVTQRQLEKEFNVSHPTINGILSRMEEKELITSRIIQENGRMQKIISITAKGTVTLNKIKTSRDNDDQKMLDLFTEEELVQLKNYMNRIIGFLNS